MCSDHSPIPLPFTLLHRNARLPTQAHAGDAGHDLHCIESFTLHPGEPRAVATGLRVHLPDGVHAKIEGRSGLAMRGVGVLGGVIDGGYTGELRVVLVNHTGHPAGFAAGDRVAQLVLHETVAVRATEGGDAIKQPTDGMRGPHGFGSSGR